MAGWLVMTAWAQVLRRALCPFWTGAGPRGRADGCPLSLPSLPRPPPGPGTGPPGAGSGPWRSGQALLASGWWRGALARKRRPRPRRDRTCREHPAAAKGPVARAWHRGPGYRRTETPAARRELIAVLPLVRPWVPPYRLASTVVGMVIGVPWRLRHPRRLTVLAIAIEAPNVAHPASCGRPGPCSGAGRGSPPARPWSQPDR